MKRSPTANEVGAKALVETRHLTVPAPSEGNLLIKRKSIEGEVLKGRKIPNTAARTTSPTSTKKTDQ